MTLERLMAEVVRLYPTIPTDDDDDFIRIREENGALLAFDSFGQIAIDGSRADDFADRLAELDRDDDQKKLMRLLEEFGLPGTETW